ncbi:radical SAM/SPASM domain-containing protein [Velocimicrobium porci]|uniref:Radical SAM protein n=1 Tax=Velocimicrobium porci TaxID=2606634 RepID=A0A6L5Y1P2_9FIRM|nr:radical SAM protein [Velocimicrobium porci]MSS64757.1 radical SAM protein [Velocimicrobium porci]
MYNFGFNIRIIKYKNKVILINSENGKWMRISKKVYEIIVWIVNENLDYEQLMNKFVDDNDQIYLKKILECLLKLGILFIKDEKIFSKKTVLFEMTNRCNLHCVHCCNNSEMCTDFELKYDEIIKIFDFLVNEQPINIILTGGEPLIRSDFLELLSYLRDNYKGKISLMTNGTLINELNVDSLISNVDEINISLDGIDESTTDIIRGEGVYKKVLTAINLLRKKRYNNITLSMVISEKNYKFQQNFIELNKKLGTKPLIRGFAEVGRGKTNKELFIEKGNKEYLENVFSDENLAVEETKNISPCTCSAGLEKILVDYKGNVFPCQWFKEPENKMGNILDNQRKEFQNNKGVKSIKKFYPWNYKRCSSCEVNAFCWPCPGELKNKAQNEEEFKQICNMIRPILFRKVWDEEV